MKGISAMRKQNRVPEASAGRRCRFHKSSKKFWATCFTLSSPLRFRFASSISSPPTCYWFGLCSWLCSSSIWFLWGVLLLNVDARWWCMYESLSIPWCHKVMTPHTSRQALIASVSLYMVASFWILICFVRSLFTCLGNLGFDWLCLFNQLNIQPVSLLWTRFDTDGWPNQRLEKMVIMIPISVQI